MIYYKPEDVYFIVIDDTDFTLQSNSIHSNINLPLGAIDYNMINPNFNVTMKLLKKILNKQWKI